MKTAEQILAAKGYAEDQITEIVQVVEIIDRLHEFRLLFVKESDQVKRINETIYTLIELFIPFSMRADFLSKYL